MPSNLEILGLSPLEDQLYRSLLEAPARMGTELARLLGASQTRTRAALRSLEEKGLISRSTEKRPQFSAVDPDVALDILVLHRREELDRVRLEITRLGGLFRALRRSPAEATEIVELVLGPRAIRERYLQLHRVARSEVLEFDRPPYATPIASVDPLHFELMARGVRLRTIYAREALETPGKLESIHATMRAGEQARIISDLRMKSVVMDRKLGLVPLTLDEPLNGALLVRESPLLEALTELFETVWEKAVPLRAPGAAPVDAGAARNAGAERPTQHEELLSLLMAGFKDQAIARQLGVDIRTVQRRARRLMDALGVETRFQAGLQAARRNWL